MPPQYPNRNYQRHIICRKKKFVAPRQLIERDGKKLSDIQIEAPKIVAEAPTPDENTQIDIEIKPQLSTAVNESITNNGSSRTLVKKSRLVEIQTNTLLEKEKFIEKVELTNNAMHEIWQNFLIENVSIIPKAYVSDINGLLPIWIDENSFKFMVASSVIKGSIDNIKSNIYTYFALRCFASPLQIFIEVEKNEAEAYVVKKNAKERLADMVQINPKIITLIQKLDLDINL